MPADVRPSSAPGYAAVVTVSARRHARFDPYRPGPGAGRLGRMPDAACRLVPAWMGEGEADVLLGRLRDGLPWEQRVLRVYGEDRKTPRLTCWVGDPGATYTYSGARHEPLPWTPELADLRERLERDLATRFNSVLANLYRDGNDSMGWHSDDEPELGVDPVIASVSLGAVRTFRFKHRFRRDLDPVDVELPHGSLLVMAGPTQRCWRHGVPKRSPRRVSSARINLTYRWVEPSGRSSPRP